MQTLPSSQKSRDTLCRHCQSGKLKLESLTYHTWLGDELITITDFPVWVCDVCGSREEDVKALNRLSLILSPNAGKPTMKKRSLTTSSNRKKPGVSHIS